MKKTSNKKGSKTKTKRAPHITKAGKRIFFSLFIFSVIMTVSMLTFGKVAADAPYVFTVNDKPVCYVADKSVADNATEEIVKRNTPEGCVVNAVDFGGLKAEPASNREAEEGDILGADEAASKILEEAKESGEFTIKVASTKVENKAYTPEPNYQADDDLFAGESIVLKEGEDGELKVATTFTMENGEEGGSEVAYSQVLSEGTPATIAKGTLGLPEGEDWKTYEGDPVFNDADDLIKTCKKYIGAPYKYGGHSLTNGIDCVQYVRQMFAKYGISIPNKHKDIQKVGKGVSLANAQPGDIVCWTHHVGIYIGNGKVINATRKKGVTISSVHMKKKLVTIRRVPRN